MLAATGFALCFAWIRESLLRGAGGDLLLLVRETPYRIALLEKDVTV